jgi:hypothetical protein
MIRQSADGGIEIELKLFNVQAQAQPEASSATVPLEQERRADASEDSSGQPPSALFAIVRSPAAEELLRQAADLQARSVEEVHGARLALQRFNASSEQLLLAAQKRAAEKVARLRRLRRGLSELHRRIRALKRRIARLSGVELPPDPRGDEEIDFGPDELDAVALES